jgi:hypothetical protein
MIMLTQFLSLSLELAPVAQLQAAILAELQRHGEPLRWAIVGVNVEQGRVQVEAVVTLRVTTV